MTTRPLADIVPVEALAQHRLDGKSYRTIARLYHVSSDRLRKYARAVLDPCLLNLRDARRTSIAQRIPKTHLIKLRLDGVSFRKIAQDYNVNRNQLQEYARQILPSHLLRNQPYVNERTERIQAGTYPCARCDIFPEPRNPLLKDGQCLWCHVEQAGLDLLWFHESGMAHAILQEIQCQQ